MINLKAIFTLLKGNLISQILPIVFYPLITRLFSAHEFGVYSILLSVIMTLSVVSVLKLDQALPISKNNEVDSIIRVSFIFNIIFSVIVYIILYFYTILVGDKTFTMTSNLIICATIFINGCSNTLIGLNIRMGHFKENSNYQVSRAITITILQILFGFLGYIKYGLLISFFIAQFVSLIYLIYLYKEKLYKVFIHIAITEDIKLIKSNYSDFPKFLTFTSLINTLGVNIPNILFNSTYGIIYAGYYGIVTRAFFTPLNMISISIAQPFLKELSEKQNTSEQLVSLCVKIVTLLSFIAIIPLGLISFNMEYIFSKVFSSEWKLAGKVAIFITPWIIINFILSPMTHVYTVKRRQNINLLLNVISVLIRSTVIILSYLFGLDFFEMLLIFGLFNFILSLIQLISVFKLIRLPISFIFEKIIIPLLLCMIISFLISKLLIPVGSILCVFCLIMIYFVYNKNKIKELFI